MPSPPVKPLQVYVRRVATTLTPVPTSARFGDFLHVSSTSPIAPDIEALPLLSLRINALVLPILLLSLFIVITYLLPKVSLPYLLPLHVFLG